MRFSSRNHRGRVKEREVVVVNNGYAVFAASAKV
jgi:hypothetical protein